MVSAIQLESHILFIVKNTTKENTLILAVYDMYEYAVAAECTSQKSVGGLERSIIDIIAQAHTECRHRNEQRARVEQRALAAEAETAYRI